MTPITLEELARAVGCAAPATTTPEIRGVSIDTRTVNPGDAFFAMPGARVDPHDLLPDAVAAGAVVVVAERDVPDIGIPVLRVTDAQAALGQLGHWYWRDRLDCTTVGITGSSGKTTTKDLIAQILEAAGLTVSPRGSFNTEVGVPLTILSADPATRFLVLEMGMRGLGHIEHLTRIATPDVAVVTNVGHAHVELLGSIDQIAVAKGELVAGLNPRGTAVLNADDPRVLAMRERTTASILTYGRAEDADLRARDIQVGRNSVDFHVVDRRAGSECTVHLAYVGEHNVFNALAALGAALACGASLADAAQALGNARPRSAMRMEMLTAPGGFLVINDAYNANPESTKAALSALAAMEGRTWAVLGEMRELGPESAALHAEVGRWAGHVGIDRLLCVGEGTRPAHEAASASGVESLWLPDADDAVAALSSELGSGDVVLVKASRSIGLERIVQALMAPTGGGAA